MKLIHNLLFTTLPVLSSHPEACLKQGGKLPISGGSGTFTGPQVLLLPRIEDIITPLSKRFPGQITIVKTNGRHFQDQLRRLSPLRFGSLRSALSALLFASLAALHAAEPVTIIRLINKLDKEDGKKLNALTVEETARGFTSLFDGVSFDGWEQKGNWVIEDGAFARVRGGGPLTYVAKTVPDDFEARFEWKVSKGCNSGVYYRPGQVEYQVLDNAGSPYGENPRQAAASLFFCMAPLKDVTRPPGQWQEGRVVCKGTVIQHWLNGVKVIDFDYTDPKWAGEMELLRIRGGDVTGRGGKLWLQDHGADVSFRKLRWRAIPAGEALVPDPNFKPMPIPPAALEKEQARVRGMLEKAK